MRQTLTTERGRTRLLRAAAEFTSETSGLDEAVLATVAAHLRDVGIPATDAEFAEYVEASRNLQALADGDYPWRDNAYASRAHAERWFGQTVQEIEAEVEGRVQKAGAR